MSASILQTSRCTHRPQMQHAVKTSNSAHHMIMRGGGALQKEKCQTCAQSAARRPQSCCTHLIHQKDVCTGAGACSLQSVIIMSGTLLMQALKQIWAAHLSKCEKHLQERAAFQQTCDMMALLCGEATDTCAAHSFPNGRSMLEVSFALLAHHAPVTMTRQLQYTWKTFETVSILGKTSQIEGCNCRHD